LLDRDLLQAMDCAKRDGTYAADLRGESYLFFECNFHRWSPLSEQTGSLFSWVSQSYQKDANIANLSLEKASTGPCQTLRTVRSGSTTYVSSFYVTFIAGVLPSQRSGWLLYWVSRSTPTPGQAQVDLHPDACSIPCCRNPFRLAQDTVQSLQPAGRPYLKSAKKLILSAQI
jgi:hypothetical protein